MAYSQGVIIEREKKVAPKPSTTATSDSTLKNIDDEKLKAISHALATMAKPSSVELERQSLAELKRDVIEHIEEITLDQAMEEALLEHAARIKLEKERLAKDKKERDEAEAKHAAEKVRKVASRMSKLGHVLTVTCRLSKNKRDLPRSKYNLPLNRSSPLSRRLPPRSNRKNKPLLLRPLRRPPLKLSPSLPLPPRRSTRPLRRPRRRRPLKPRSRDSLTKRSDRLLSWRKPRPRNRNCESTSPILLYN